MTRLGLGWSRELGGGGLPRPLRPRSETPSVFYKKPRLSSGGPTFRLLEDRVPSGWDSRLPAAVGVVTVNWNGWRDTLACLEALRTTRGVAWRLYIVDNASTDDSREHLSNLGDDVTLISSPVNGGWTGGNNTGISHALAAGHEHILVLNNDAFVQPDTLAAFLAAHADAPDAILGGVQRTDDGSLKGAVGNRRNPRTGVMTWLPIEELGPPQNGLVATASVIGTALFVHRRVYQAIGPFDDDFYLYYDESDWCMRGAKLGHASFVVERAGIRHIGAASTGGRSSPLVTYFMTRNSLLFVQRHGTWRQLLTLARTIVGGILRDTRAAEHGISTADVQVRARVRGVLDYMLRRFGDCPASVRQMQQDWRSV